MFHISHRHTYFIQTHYFQDDERYKHVCHSVEKLLPKSLHKKRPGFCRFLSNCLLSENIVKKEHDNPSFDWLQTVVTSLIAVAMKWIVQMILF